MVPSIGDLVAQYFTEDVMSSLPVPASRLAFCQDGGSWDAATQDIPSGAGVTQRKLKGYLAPQPLTDRRAVLCFPSWVGMCSMKCGVAECRRLLPGPAAHFNLNRGARPESCGEEDGSPRSC